MPLTTAAKVALCVCPPALMAGTVATVPQVKRAVHHITAPRHAPKSIHKTVARKPAASNAVAQRQVDCDPVAGGALPAVPLVTYAAPGPDEPTGGSLQTAGLPPTPIAGIGIGGGGGGTTTPTTPVVVTPPVTGPVPEPSVWLMMIVGVGTLGAALRRRRTAGMRDGNGKLVHKATLGGLLWSGSAAVEAGDMAATVAVKSVVASAAGKAMLCVCPAAIVAGSVMTVPPVRQAVYAATLPAEPVSALPPAALPAQIVQPCAEPMTVPVAASSVDSFPASIETVPAAPATVTAMPVAATATAG